MRGNAFNNYLGNYGKKEGTSFNDAPSFLYFMTKFLSDRSVTVYFYIP